MPNNNNNNNNNNDDDDDDDAIWGVKSWRIFKSASTKKKKILGEFSGLINPNKNILKEVSGRVGRENIRRERKVHVA